MSSEHREAGVALSVIERISSILDNRPPDGSFLRRASDLVASPSRGHAAPSCGGGAHQADGLELLRAEIGEQIEELRAEFSNELRALSTSFARRTAAEVERAVEAAERAERQRAKGIRTELDAQETRMQALATRCMDVLAEMRGLLASVRASATRARSAPSPHAPAHTSMAEQQQGVETRLHAELRADIASLRAEVRVASAAAAAAASAANTAASARQSGASAANSPLRPARPLGATPPPTLRRGRVPSVEGARPSAPPPAERRRASAERQVQRGELFGERLSHERHVAQGGTGGGDGGGSPLPRRQHMSPPHRRSGGASPAQQMSGGHARHESMPSPSSPSSERSDSDSGRWSDRSGGWRAGGSHDQRHTHRERGSVRAAGRPSRAERLERRCAKLEWQLSNALSHAEAFRALLAARGSPAAAPGVQDAWRADDMMHGVASGGRGLAYAAATSPRPARARSSSAQRRTDRTPPWGGPPNPSSHLGAYTLGVNGMRTTVSCSRAPHATPSSAGRSQRGGAQPPQAHATGLRGRGHGAVIR